MLLRLLIIIVFPTPVSRISITGILASIFNKILTILMKLSDKKTLFPNFSHISFISFSLFLFNENKIFICSTN